MEGMNQTDIKTMEFNDHKDFYEKTLHEDVYYYLMSKKNNNNIRRLSEIPNFYKHKSDEHSFSHTIDNVIMSVILSNILIEAKNIIKTKYKDSLFDSNIYYNGIYFKLDYNESTNPNIVTGTLILYYQTNENYIDEIKNRLDLLKNSEKDMIKDYLKESTSLFECGVGY